MADPRWSSDNSTTKTLPDYVAQVYYTYGLVCATFPALILTVTCFIVLICCYPLMNLPLPGNIPQYFVNYAQPSANLTLPRWLNKPPKCYVQQVIVRSMVSPWTEDLSLMDAFRSPLAESFKLMETIGNFQTNTSLSSNDVCLHVEMVNDKSTAKMSSVFPEFNCLILSPANLWRRDFRQFLADVNLINTVYNYQNLAKGKISVSEMLVGLPLKYTGLKRYPFRTKQRVIQYAVTIFLDKYDADYLHGLEEHLKRSYNFVFGDDTADYGISQQHYVYYPEYVSYLEFIPISATYILVFAYMYFSVRKMEHVRSKITMAFTAVLTVLASLGMTIGICFFFGLQCIGKGNGKQIVPYLVIIVGMENMFVLTKSVVSTTGHLDVKIRIAQGLSKEGWNITKNFLGEITILTFGLFTCRPVIQEFCVFAVVGLLCDFFLQLVFFATILSLNVKREEKSPYPNYSYCALSFPNEEDARKIVKSKSHPRLAGQNMVASATKTRCPVSTNDGVSKRVKVVHFWARTRFVQRGFMVFMVLWIAVIAYNVNWFRFLPSSNGSSKLESTAEKFITTVADYNNRFDLPQFLKSLKKSMLTNEKEREEEEAARMKRMKEMMSVAKGAESTGENWWLRGFDLDVRTRLQANHFSSVLSVYNVSTAGSYVAILPPIRVAYKIPLEVARALKNPEERGMKFRWQSLAVALDPIDFTDVENSMQGSMLGDEVGERPLMPSSILELVMASLMCIVSFIVLVYASIMTYRCVCSRNYAEWRTTWTTSSENMFAAKTQIVLEALPISIEGHKQLIECVVTDGNVIVSTCLAGDVKIWDVTTGEPLAIINRKSDMMEDLERGCCDNNYYRAENDRITNGGYNFWQNGDLEFPDSCGGGGESAEVSPIWCLDCRDNLIALGCADGNLEFWEGCTGDFKCQYREDNEISVTSVRIAGKIVVAAKLNGMLCFYRLDKISASYYNSSSNAVYTPAHNVVTKQRIKGHFRSGSAGSIYKTSEDITTASDNIRCVKLESIKAHNKSIVVLEVEGGRVITGSEDYTVKVFLLETLSVKYTLHGHCGPITSIFVDKMNSVIAGSGSQDGMLCVWDLLTGWCIYSIQAHDGAVSALTYSASYVVSLGQDDRLCVWDRFQGHLLKAIPTVDSYCISMCMLTHNLLITSTQGCLVVLDVGTGETVRIVKLSRSNSSVFVRHILSLGDGVICDYGDQLRIVRFPLVYDKYD